MAFSITAIMMMVLLAYTWYTVKRRSGTCCNRFGPFIFTAVAVPLVLADQMRHVLQDLNVWPGGPWPGSSEYRPGCPDENMSCLSALGWVFTVGFTYSGFVCIAIGTLWNSNIMSKCQEFRAKWVELRGGAADSKA